MQIAQELDAAEKAFMAEGGVDSEDFRSFLAEDSGNVSSDGFFSIQVFASSCTTASMHSVHHAWHLYKAPPLVVKPASARYLLKSLGGALSKLSCSSALLMD